MRHFLKLRGTHAGIVHRTNGGTHDEGRENAIDKDAFVFIPQAESQPQRRAGGNNRNNHGQPHEAAIPDDAAIQHQGRHTDVVHRHHASAQDCRGKDQSKGRKFFARDGNIKCRGRCNHRDAQ